MKVKKYYLLILLSLLIIPTSCSETKRGSFNMQIYVASDLHLLSNNLVSNDNQIFKKEVLTADGRVQELDYDIVNSFIDDINTNKPKYAFLTGDLTFNGEKDSHLELTKLLDRCNDETKVLLIPGNHDCYNLKATTYIDDKYAFTPTISKDEFKEIYQNYGYNGAFSYDKETLSYIYPLSNNIWALMLDTTLSHFNYELDSNIVGGQLFESTYQWLDDNLKYAYNNDIKVISFSHHNLITHNKLFERMYTLYDNTTLCDLFAKYNVLLNFSGHLHIQNIASININNKTLYDIASNSLTIYKNQYGVLDIYDNLYDYNVKQINLKDVDLDAYSYDVMVNKYYNKKIISASYYYGDNADKITKKDAMINALYFAGLYKDIHKEYRQNKKFYNSFIDDDNHKYTKEIINSTPVDQTNIKIKYSK